MLRVRPKDGPWTCRTLKDRAEGAVCVRPDPGEAADLPGHSRMHILNSPSSASIVVHARIVFLVRVNKRHLPTSERI